MRKAVEFRAQIPGQRKRQRQSRGRSQSCHQHFLPPQRPARSRSGLLLERGADVRPRSTQRRKQTGRASRRPPPRSPPRMDSRRARSPGAKPQRLRAYRPLPNSAPRPRVKGPGRRQPGQRRRKPWLTPSSRNRQYAFPRRRTGQGRLATSPARGSRHARSWLGG